MQKRRFYCLEPDISKVYTLQLLLQKAVFYRLTIFHTYVHAHIDPINETSLIYSIYSKTWLINENWSANSGKPLYNNLKHCGLCIVIYRANVIFYGFPNIRTFVKYY